jgi:hypothetical protein
MNPLKQPMTRIDLIKLTHDIMGEAAKLRLDIEQLKKDMKLAEDINECQQRTIRSLTEERLQHHYG